MNIVSYVAAGYPFLALKTLEPLRAKRLVFQRINEYNKTLSKKDRNESGILVFKWDINRNFFFFNRPSQADSGKKLRVLRDAAIQGFPAYEIPANTEKNINIQQAIDRVLSHDLLGLLIIENLNDSMTPQIYQLFLNYANLLKNRNVTILFIDSSFSKFKGEFHRMMTFIDLPLPSVKELRKIAEECYSVVKDDPQAEEMTEEDLDWVAEQSRGLTEFEAENIFSRSLTMHGKILVDDVMQEKVSIIKENAALEVYSGPKVTFKDVGGMENAKFFCKRTIDSPLAKGALMTGVPGAGKSLFAKALAGETNRWCVILKFSRLFDKFVGGTEERIDMTLKTIDSLGKIVLMIDEIDKVIGGSMGGAGGGGKTTGNEVSMRAIGTFLTWMQERKSGDAYVIATCNNVMQMVETFPEFFRTGRWDIVYFVDVPSEEEKKEICKIKARQFNFLDEKGNPIFPKNFEMIQEGWTGSDIEQLYRTASMLSCSLEEAREMIIPLTQTAGGSIEAIRNWAQGRTILANGSFLSQRNYSESEKSCSKRKIRRIVSSEDENNKKKRRGRSRRKNQ